MILFFPKSANLLLRYESACENMMLKKHMTKGGLKFNIQKTKIMASGPTTSWEIDGETVETVSDSILGGSKITADGDFGAQKNKV